MAGYSGTPLAKKLGLKPGQKAYFMAMPESISDELAAALAAMDVTKRLQADIDFMHVFFTKKSALDQTLPNLKKNLAKDGSLWISWPKKTASIATDLTGDLVRESGLGVGLVDIKVCAVDEQWSGLKFVYRKSDR